jgi:hypothetical protein
VNQWWQNSMKLGTAAKTVKLSVVFTCMLNCGTDKITQPSLIENWRLNPDDLQSVWEDVIEMGGEG